MAGWSEQVGGFFRRGLWRIDIDRLGFLRRFAVQSLRVVMAVGHEFIGGQLTLRAMSLVYTTLLSLVPLLAVSFSVLKAFGVHNQIEPVLMNFVAPFGAAGTDLVERILGFVANVKVGVLGAVGLAFLLYTVISVLQKIEKSFNYVWHIRRPRTLARRFSDYLSVIMVGPVLVFSAMGMTASIMNHAWVQTLVAIEPFGTAVLLAGKIAPYVFIIGAFTFMYIFVPNTRVRFVSALAGATIAGVLWQTVGVGFAAFVKSSTNYTAIYSSFAILALFMIWLYLSWLILLLGAQIAFFHQYPHQVRLEGQQLRFSNRLKEWVGFAAMYLITDSYYRGARPWSPEAIAQRLGVPTGPVGELLDVLHRRGLLVETVDGGNGYVPAREPAQITLSHLRAVLRSAEEDEFPISEGRLDIGPVEALVGRQQEAVEEVLSGLSLRDLSGPQLALPDWGNGEEQNNDGG